jgi:hypothetical protein
MRALPSYKQKQPCQVLNPDRVEKSTTEKINDSEYSILISTLLHQKPVNLAT